MADGPAVFTRFAPSPTGHLHVGGARTALFCWALARAQGGHFLLRVEDTDQERSSEDAVSGILEDLAWLGLDWQEGPEHVGAGGDPRGVGPFFQSQRLTRYDEAIASLIERDLAYPAFDTPEELEAARREAQAQKRTFRYERPVDWNREEAQARAEQEDHVIRFRAPGVADVVHDVVLGPVNFEADAIDDFVLRKRGGFPTYHLAVVVDDHDMGVTHVLRGQEHLNNTPKHQALQAALGLSTPIYAHLPIIQNPDGSKMSKRDRDKAARAALREQGVADPGPVRERATKAVPADRLDAWLKDKRGQLETSVLEALESACGLSLPGIVVNDFRREGYLPEVLVNFLALLGWSSGEKTEDGRDLERFDPDYLARHFTLERIGRGNARFDRAKLLAFNQESLAALPDTEFEARFTEWAKQNAEITLAQLGNRLPLYLRALKPRIRTFGEAVSQTGPGGFVLRADDSVVYEDAAVTKWLRKGEPNGFERLTELQTVLAEVEPFEPENLEATVAAWCEKNGVGMGKAAQPLRVAVTGAAASPPLGETLALLGRASCLARIARCLQNA
ncbi:glutamate--tRNA ligase [Myxococcota bacterium]|nr:glutamate--tRNA ligase [Myxococcota bacterium]